MPGGVKKPISALVKNTSGGIFLLHFPGSRLRRTLSVILPYDARTFLAVIPFGNIRRDSPTRSRMYYTKKYSVCQASRDAEQVK